LPHSRQAAFTAAPHALQKRPDAAAPQDGQVSVIGQCSRYEEIA
jgi:hypothetical protein